MKPPCVCVCAAMCGEVFESEIIVQRCFSAGEKRGGNRSAHQVRTFTKLKNARCAAYLQRWVLFEGVPVLGVVAVGVSHGVRVLAEDDRPRFVALLRNADDLIDACVHWTDDVRRTRAAAAAFVLDRPRIVALADKAGHGEVR